MNSTANSTGYTAIFCIVEQIISILKKLLDTHALLRRHLIMSIDLKTEKLIPLTQASKLLPQVDGKRIHISTLWRWCKKGLKGINLEYIRTGSKIITSKEAMQRFFDAVTKLDETQPPQSFYKPEYLKNKTRSEKSRQRQIENANNILVKAKIIQ
ncbi:MAG: hypothetical protein A2Y12_17205 [Planctomycetes bacterium GWF2_42_9]|nr:MAG: hypothetical protein A2Y12_17205 [Planctomycetes bacterium GWF2_42_9]